MCFLLHKFFLSMKNNNGDSMHPFIYLAIFALKLLENALGTIRMIFAMNGKKILSSILQFLIGIVWVASASLAITNVASDPLKVLVFALGSAIGSYVGCAVESKLAMGENVLICITKEMAILNQLSVMGYTYTTLLGSGTEDSCYVILLAIPRKKKKEMIASIKKIDKKSMIISEGTDTIVGGSVF